ncbi:MAG: hypothetical protein H6741_08595 [Alphaproteobacteria bacterium]|nr:hypothetical protein [Alphaproteobacteria bacterium]MCB9792776.1 hypothetical protein [Alphaproteobacteria bacterium]
MRCLILALLLGGCTHKGGDDSGSGDDTSGASGFDLYAASTTRLVLEVDWADGAEPYTGAVGLGGDAWDLFEENVDALLQGTRTLEVPHDLADMESIGDQGEGPYDVDAILALAEAHRDTASGGDTASFYAIWLDGYFADEDGTRDSVIGVSIGRTGVIAMFKPVIEQLGLTRGAKAIGEQTTLIHEVGHALGLVNNGVELTAQHHDAEHGAHCSNNECVMYWANEGPGEMAQFVSGILSSGDVVLFDDDCLNDVGAALE